MRIGGRGLRSMLVAAVLLAGAGPLASCGGGGGEDKDDYEQVVIDIVKQTASSLGSVGNQGMEPQRKLARTIRTTYQEGPNHGPPYTVTMALMAEPIPGFAGYAVLNGNMKVTINAAGGVSGDFLISAVFEDAKTSGNDTIDGRLTYTGTLIGLGENGVKLDFSTGSGNDFAINGRSHSVLLRTIVVATPQGISSCSTTGIVDSRSVAFSCS